MTASMFPPAPVETPEDLLNAAMWHAASAATDAFVSGARRDFSPAGTAALATAEAERAAQPLLARVIGSAVLRDAYARAVAGEAVRMVRELGPAPAPDGEA